MSGTALKAPSFGISRRYGCWLCPRSTQLTAQRSARHSQMSCNARSTADTGRIRRRVALMVDLPEFLARTRIVAVHRFRAAEIMTGLPSTSAMIGVLWPLRRSPSMVGFPRSSRSFQSAERSVFPHGLARFLVEPATYWKIRSIESQDQQFSKSMGEEDGPR